MERLVQQLDWPIAAPTTTTHTFMRIKEYVLAVKADPNIHRIILGWSELRENLETHYQSEIEQEDWTFSDDDIVRAVQHLQTHGYVRIIRLTNGNSAILLAPDLLINLASSFVIAARANPDGRGALVESQLLRGEYPLPELD